jgi:hypothetical protein
MSYAPAIKYLDSPNLDPYARLRASNADTVFEADSTYDANPLALEAINTSDGVAPAWNSTTRMTDLKINSGATGGSSLLQSYQYMPYSSGKGLLVRISGLFGTGTTGAVKRFGLGDADNGYFLEQNGTALQVNRRTKTSGSAVDNTVAQASWNLDKLDGSGPSGFTFDVTKVFTFVIDMASLVGRARFGFLIGGQIIYFHQFLIANVIALPSMQTLSLPLLTEIRAAAGLGGAATASLESAMVAVEGGFEILHTGRNFSASNQITAGNGTRTAALSVRPAATFSGIATRGLFILENLDVMAIGNQPVQWELCLGVTFGGGGSPVFASVGSYSFMEVGPGGTYSSLSSGVVIETGQVGGTGSMRGMISEDISFAYPITLDRSGSQRALGTLTLLLTGQGGTVLSNADFNWREIR